LTISQQRTTNNEQPTTNSMSITEISIKRPALVIVIFTVLGILGLISYSKLNYNLLPEFEAPVLSVVTIYPGAAAGEVETSVTKRIEDALSSLENLDKIQSTSREGVSLVVIQLLQSADVDEAVQDAQRKVNAILARLPDEVESPTINKFSTGDLPVLQLGVSGNLSPTQFYKLVEDRIQPQLAKVQGVGQITLVGGEQREIQVNVDPEKLRAYNLSLNQVTQVIAGANQDFPTGKVQTPEQQYSLRVAAKFASLNDIRSQVIAYRPGGSRVTVADVAEVVDGVAEITTLNRINGRSSVGIVIQKQADANAVEVSKQIRSQVANLEKMYGAEGVKFSVANDTSTYTLASASAV
jgi:HAE1 family hydrophobic/amphiphilic exporter-1